MPNLDDSIYFYLIEILGVKQEQYDQLIIGQSAFIFVAAATYYMFLRD